MSFVSKLLILASIFSLGFFTCLLLAEPHFRYALSDTAVSVVSPTDKIRPEEVKVYPDKTVIERPNIIWAKIKDTHSMEPILTSDSISLEVKPSSPMEISVGDIITYMRDKIVIIHRVVNTGYDSDGWFAVTKGDNNQDTDPLKVRFEQIKGVVIGILY